MSAEVRSKDLKCYPKLRSDCEILRPCRRPCRLQCWNAPSQQSPFRGDEDRTCSANSILIRCYHVPDLTHFCVLKTRSGFVRGVHWSFTSKMPSLWPPDCLAVKPRLQTLNLPCCLACRELYYRDNKSGYWSQSLG